MFRNMARITFLPVIFATGETGLLLFACKGEGLDKETIINSNGKEVTSLMSEYLPRGAIVIRREDVAGVESKTFLEFAKTCMENVKDLMANGRKFVLTNDGYHYHLGWQVLQVLEEGGVIAAPGLTHPKTHQTHHSRIQGV